MIMQPPDVRKAKLTGCSVECLSWALGLLVFKVSRVCLGLFIFGAGLAVIMYTTCVLKGVPYALFIKCYYL